jgi:hypothetical protein
MKTIIKTAAVLALIAPAASFASGVYDFPTFNSEAGENAAQPVTQLDTSVAKDAVVTSEANDQK